MEVLMDYVEQLNWVAVLVSAAAAFAVGAIWFSQAVFGKAWMKGQTFFLLRPFWTELDPYFVKRLVK